jgi:hypothetical protein
VGVESERYRDSLVELIEGYNWDVYATLTFEDRDGRINPVSVDWASKCVHWLVEKLGKGAYAYLALERGVAGKRIHCHVLLGWKGARVTAEKKAFLCRLVQRSWPHGREMKIEPYQPRGGAVRYLTKDSTECPEQGEFIGQPQKLNRRKRGKRKRKATVYTEVHRKSQTAER